MTVIFTSFVIFCLTIFDIQLTTSQSIRPQLNGPAESITDFYLTRPTIISDPPTNSIIPISSSLSNTILITDCSPSACQNLADTIQLMIVCNLLQNTQGGRDLALQLAGPVINQLISSPVFSCGCPNPLFSGALSPNVLNQGIVTGNSIASSIIPSNIVSSNAIASNVISPASVSPNVFTPTIINPNLASPNPGCPNQQIVSPKIFSPSIINPNVVSSNPGCPNQPINSPCSCPACTNSLVAGFFNYV